MGQFYYGRCWIFIMVVCISNALADNELLTTPTLQEIQLSETELLYLNERLQGKDHMSYDDAVNTIIELEHFYTLMKNDHSNTSFSPSVMVDKAWHQHILYTEMYQNFSRKYFDIDILHHLPFWSGNIEEVMKQQKDNEEIDHDATYKSLVAMFGLKNVNETVWHWVEEESDPHPSNTIINIEL